MLLKNECSTSDVVDIFQYLSQFPSPDQQQRVSSAHRVSSVNCENGETEIKYVTVAETCNILKYEYFLVRMFFVPIKNVGGIYEICYKVTLHCPLVGENVHPKYK